MMSSLEKESNFIINILKTWEEVEIIKETKLIRRQWKCQNAFPLENNKEKFNDYTKLPILDYEN